MPKRVGQKLVKIHDSLQGNYTEKKKIYHSLMEVLPLTTGKVS